MCIQVLEVILWNMKEEMFDYFFFFFNINFVLTKLVIHLSKISPYLYFDICVYMCVLVQKFPTLSFTLYYGNLRSVFENFLVHTYSSRNVCKQVITIFWWQLWLNIKYAASSVYSSCLIWEKVQWKLASDTLVERM